MAVERSVLLRKSRNRIDILATEIWFSDIVLKIGWLLRGDQGFPKSENCFTILQLQAMLIFQVCPYLDFLSFAFGHHSPVERGAGRHLYSHSVEGSKTMRLGDLPGPERAPPGSWKLLITSPQPTDAQEGNFLAFTEKKTLVCFTFFFPFMLTSQLKVESQIELRSWSELKWAPSPQRAATRQKGHHSPPQPDSHLEIQSQSLCLCHLGSSLSPKQTVTSHRDFQ